MAFQSFVSENFLKQFTPLSNNIDVQEIIPHLHVVELINVREVVGKLLYDDIKAKYIAQTLSSDEIVLVEYIKNLVAYKAASEALPFMSIKITPKGATKLSGENSQPATVKEIEWLQGSLKSKAEYFAQRLVDYLCLNPEKFPLFRDADNESGIVSVENEQYDSDFYFDDYDYDYKKYFGPNTNL